MATKFSDFTAGGTPANGDFVGGYLAAGGAGSNRRWTFAQAATYMETALAGIFASVASVAAKADTTAVTAALAALDQTNPANVIWIKDEFLFSSTETGEQGELGWSFTNGTLNITSPVSGYPGIVARASTAVAATVASMFSAGGGASPVIRQDQWTDQTWVIQPQSAVADHDVRFGFAVDFTAATPATGIYFEKLAADTNWFVVCRSGGVQTRTDTGVAYSVAWFKMKIRRISGTSIGFTLNGGTEIVISTNVPVAGTLWIFGNHIIPQSANARTVWIDFFSMTLAAMAR